jgi:hypothetical protein
MQSGLTQLVSFPPAGGPGTLLSNIGHVTPAIYSYTTPGGCDQLSTTFQRPPRYRTDALKQGAILRGFRGGSVVWEGLLDEPAPGDNGWTVTAQGAGKYGDNWRAVYSGAWGSGVADTIVNNAITRGADWVNPGIGSPSGIWYGQAVDSASEAVTDILNLITSKGGLTWQVTTGPNGNVLSVFALPTTPNRLLVCPDPAAQAVASEPDALLIRYQSTADNGTTPAAYATTTVTQDKLITATGRREGFMDLSSTGVQTAGSSQAVGNQVLKRYIRAAFTQPFVIKYGELMNMGGTPTDPGFPYADGMTAMVCQALLSDFTLTGEAGPGPVIFMVGAYAWDDGERVATVTPFGYLRQDFGGLLSMVTDTTPVRVTPAVTTKKKK